MNKKTETGLLVKIFSARFDLNFQVDEEDVNKLLETETEGVSVGQGSEERTDLEDVFRWKMTMVVKMVGGGGR